MLLAVDDSLGPIVATLARKGILDDTMVVFTSDHGDFYASTGSTKSDGWPTMTRSPAMACGRRSGACSRSSA